MGEFFSALLNGFVNVILWIASGPGDDHPRTAFLRAAWGMALLTGAIVGT